jgi:hypothetical protein
MVHFQWLLIRPYGVRLFLAMVAFFLFFSLTSSADAIDPLLQAFISEYNQKALSKSLQNDTYRGEAGTLRIRPEVAVAFGMKVLMDSAYKKAKQKNENANKAYQDTLEVLENSSKENMPEDHAREIVRLYLLYKDHLHMALNSFSTYRSRLTAENDERLDRNKSIDVMNQILESSFKQTGHNLRDGLGRFYNECQGEKRNQGDVTPENVRFVNTIYRQCVQAYAKGQLDRFDLDRIGPFRKGESSASWKRILKKRCPQCVPFLEETLKPYEKSAYFVDPLLFIALIRKESSFNPLAVSHVGAGGLLQIMPRTGKDLGMKNIFDPPYFDEAFALLRKERNYRKQALKVLQLITDPEDIDVAKKAHEHMKAAFVAKNQREKLFERYRRELLERRDDDRLQPNLAIEFGYKYFASLLKTQKGDISLALASYNAGPHRVATYGGIPPFQETVNFRNRVLKYYRQYLRMAESGDKNKP